jgi:hypothetical protein
MSTRTQKTRLILPSLLAASALALVVSQPTYAQTGTGPVTGSGTNTNTVNAYANTTNAYSGTASLAGDEITISMTQNSNAGFLILESTLVLDVNTGLGTTTLTSCGGSGASLACGGIPLGTSPYAATTSSFVNDIFSWTLNFVGPPESNGNVLTINDSYTATISATAPPVTTPPPTSGDSTVAVPTLSVPGLAFTAFGLLVVGIRKVRKSLK